MTEKSKAESAIECVVRRAIWDENGVRIDAGQVISVPASDAMDGVEEGYLTRSKADK